MQRRVAEAICVMTLTVLSSRVEGANGYKASCTATAGLGKHVAGTTTAATERTGSYEVRLTGSTEAIELAIDPKGAVSAGTATKVPATIERVLLRSPYKSEAAALPRESHVGKGGASHVATFDPDAVRALPAGDVDVVVVTPDGERACRISKSARQKLTGR